MGEMPPQTMRSTRGPHMSNTPTQEVGVAVPGTHAQLSSEVPSAHHEHRTIRVMDQTLADRTEDSPGDLPVSAASDHHELCRL